MTGIKDLGRKGADERQKERRTYDRPQILSSDRLEAAAATCTITGPAFGKTVPVPCGTLGS